MRFRLFPALALAALVACCAHTARAVVLQEQQNGEVEEAFTQTRGIAFGTRPTTTTATKPAAKPTPKPKPKPRPSTGARPTGGRSETASGAGKAPKGGAGGSGGGSARNPPAAGASRPDKLTGTTGGAATNENPGDAEGNAPPPGADSVPSDAPAIGLGYTLFVNDPDGNPVVVDSAKEFKAGDKIRVMLEPNVDGYLYIFHTEDDHNPEMLYPNVLLDEARNRIEAHARDFVPANLRDSFIFDDQPAIERLYIVLSRQPLEGVPTGARLFDYCGARRQDCNWTPTPAVWERVKSYAAAPVTESRAKTPTKISLAKNTISRGLKVLREEPPPAVIRMGSSPAEGVLVTTVDLVHK